MSNVIPTGLKAGPSTTNSIAANRYLIIYVIQIWLSIFPEFFVFMAIATQFEIRLAFLLLLFPLYLFLAYFLLVFSSLFWSWVILKCVNLIHKPREGYFPRSKDDKDFRFWTLRAVVKKFPVWVCHNFPVPWADNLAFRLFGNNVSISTPTYDAWIDTEFLDIGHGTTIGQGSVIMTSMLTTELLIIKRVKIGKNCLVGAHSVVLPGTTIGDNTILGALSSTSLGQDLEPGWVYMGTPAIQYRESKFREDDDLTPEERANLKKSTEVEEVIAENEELKGRKTPIAYYQLKKQGYKERRAQKHIEKAQTKRERAQRKLERAEWRAEKHEILAEKKEQESLHAMEIAKKALDAKIEKERTKIHMIEENERLKTQQDKKNRRERERVSEVKDRLFSSYIRQKKKRDDSEQASPDSSGDAPDGVTEDTSEAPAEGDSPQQNDNV